MIRDSESLIVKIKYGSDSDSSIRRPAGAPPEALGIAHQIELTSYLVG